jgi:D-alanine-D-alanine ligase-like ATP-grasp enzyme
MRELGLRFGRIDLLANDLNLGKFWFLEVNPNGQWAWLDLEQRNGLFDAVIRFLTSE